MTEEEEIILHNLLNNKTFCRESVFKKTYPEIYNKISDLYEQTDFKFVQKLYHYFYNKDIDIGGCERCGKRCRFRSLRVGYDKYCSQDCYKSTQPEKQSKEKKYNSKSELIDLILESPSSSCREKRFKIYFPVAYEEIQSMSFPDGFIFPQKLYHYIHNDVGLELGVCHHCGKRTKFINIKKGYLTFCSSRCAYFDKDVTDKRNQTNYELYGTSCPQKSQIVIEKIKQSNISKTNEENELIREKQRQTNLELYGCECSFQNEEVKNKSYQTKLLRYGDEKFVNKEKSVKTIVNKYKSLFGNCEDLSDDEIVSLYFSKLSNKSFETRKKN